jgi:hypothetical protein
MRRLQHLASVERMKIRIVVVQPLGGCVQHVDEPGLVTSAWREVGELSEAGIQLLHGFQKRIQALLFKLQKSPIIRRKL